MRALVVALALFVSSCAFGAGVNPVHDATSSSVTTGTTAPPGTTSTTANPVTRQAVVSTAEAFFDAMSAGEWTDAVGLVADAPGDLADTLAAWVAELGLTSLTYVVLGDETTPQAATVDVSATLTPAGFAPWQFETTVALTRETEGWRIEWAPSILYPDLEEGDTLQVRAVWQQRASILARDGTALATTAAAWTIGVVPERITDLDALTTTLQDLAGIEPDTVTTELARPGVQPDWFVPVGTILASRPAAVAALQGTAGVMLRETTLRIRPYGDLAGDLIGGVGTITADRLGELGPPYGAADEVGLSGLEAAFETRLAGTPDLTIVRINRYGRDVATVLSAVGTAPADVLTTIDVTVQAAAERALDGITKPAAVVIVDTQTSDVLASVSRPAGGYDRAFLGTYPPGSTYKIVTAAALLSAGMTPDDTVACPGEVTLGGLHIPNAGNRDLGTITLQTAFAQSCNTTFTALAVQRLSADAMSTMAATFGLDVPEDVGVPAATSHYPYPADTAELAASAMGQGRDLLTPLHQATIAAAVASGGWLPARLVLTGSDDRERTHLDAGVRSDLAQMMLAVVNEGGGGKAKVPGEVVRGKTGSAEYDTLGHTHAWFVGYWDHYAFAVVVEAGGSGGQTSAPIAAAIIRELAG